MLSAERDLLARVIRHCSRFGKWPILTEAEHNPRDDNNSPRVNTQKKYVPRCSKSHIQNIDSRIHDCLDLETTHVSRTGSMEFLV